jgi:hypothetical protein
MERRPSGARVERKEGKKGVTRRIERYIYRLLDAKAILFPYAHPRFSLRASPAV